MGAFIEDAHTHKQGACAEAVIKHLIDGSLEPLRVEGEHGQHDDDASGQGQLRRHAGAQADGAAGRHRLEQDLLQSVRLGEAQSQRHHRHHGEHDDGNHGRPAEDRLGQCPAESLGREGFPAIPIVNPANRKANSIIPRAARAAAGAGGRQTWSPLGYLVLALAAELRTHSANLLDGQLTTDALARLETAFPDLVGRARAVYAIEPLTAVLRHLLQEQISIRDLRGILERLLDFDVIVTDQRKYIAFDDRLPTGKSPSARWRQEPVNLAAFVRMGMKNYISHKYTRGQRTLIVYLLAPDIEQRLEAALENERGLPQETADGIRRAVRTEIGTPSPDAAIPALLTTINVRAILRRCIAAEFPRLPVLAYQELSPVLNVQPIARLTLS